MANPKQLLQLFNQPPFTNGGLFFDHNPVQPGILNLLDRYQFTIEETTPIEQEAALDPELLSQVFENSFAAYNPKTGPTTRQPPGSYYTPREVVNHIAQEAPAEKSQAQLQEISVIFQRDQHSDYGRNLYLLPNNIPGVALPSIAGHLAKLRLFISLTIKQQPNPNPQENFGFQPRRPRPQLRNPLP